MLGVLTLIVTAPLVVYIHFRKMDQWTEQSFQDKFGTLLEGVRVEDNSTRKYKVLILTHLSIFFVRRIIFVFALFILEKQPMVQLSILMLCSLGMLVFLIEVRPFSDDRSNKIEMFNEATQLILIYILIQFTSLTNNEG